MDLSGFLSAYFSDWVGWMSGPFSIVLVILGFYKKEANQKRLFWIAAGLAFLVAPVHIWTSEHKARLLAEDKSKPKLELNVISFYGGMVEGKPSLLFQVSLRNLGAPSIAGASSWILLAGKI